MVVSAGEGEKEARFREFILVAGSRLTGLVSSMAGVQLCRPMEAGDGFGVSGLGRGNLFLMQGFENELWGSGRATNTFMPLRMGGMTR